MRVRTFRRTCAAATVALVLMGLAFGTTGAQAQMRAPGAAACTVPASPGDELHANADSSITITLTPVAGATSYDIYRSTASGAEGSTPYATITSTTYVDKNLSSTPIYFYVFTAVNSCGQSAHSAEDASKTPPPIGTGGNTPGVANGNSLVFYCEDALLGGFDWFQTLTGWFPQVLGSSGSTSPNQRVIDMAYATAGSLTFSDVVVPTAGLYTIDWRYAFQGGLFPSVKNRQMGLEVNGTVITTTERFPITGSFDVYQHSFLQAHLNAGKNSISMLAASDHGVSRVDQLTVTPANASVPSGPTNLTATAGNGSETLTWAGSSSGGPTSYSIYRGTATDGEATTPIATTNGTTTTFTDTGLRNGTTYFYNVAANNAVGVSPDSNEVSVVPGGTGTGPTAPTGLTASGTTSTSTNLSWTASTDSAGVAGYHVLQNGATVATVTGTTYTATGLSPSTAYTYQVNAFDTAGNVSTGSNTISVSTQGGTGGGSNLALNHPATASSLEGAGYPASAAVDGSLTTRWSSAFADPQWLEVDLGATHTINQVVLSWENAYGKAFQIQTSTDNVNWTSILSITTGTGGTQTLNVSGSGRYIRMYGTARGTGYGYSLWEFQVIGT